MKYQLQEKMIFMLSSTLWESDISKFKNLSRSFSRAAILLIANRNNEKRMLLLMSN